MTGEIHSTINSTTSVMIKPSHVFDDAAEVLQTEVKLKFLIVTT